MVDGFLCNWFLMAYLLDKDSEMSKREVSEKLSG